MAYRAGFDGPEHQLDRWSSQTAELIAVTANAVPAVIVPKPKTMLEAMSALRRAGSGAHRGFIAWVFRGGYMSRGGGMYMGGGGGGRCAKGQAPCGVWACVLGSTSTRLQPYACTVPEFVVACASTPCSGVRVTVTLPSGFAVMFGGKGVPGGAGSNQGSGSCAEAPPAERRRTNVVTKKHVDCRMVQECKAIFLPGVRRRVPRIRFRMKLHAIHRWDCGLKPLGVDWRSRCH
jgi:hypothetical protein